MLPHPSYKVTGFKSSEPQNNQDGVLTEPTAGIAQQETGAAKAIHDDKVKVERADVGEGWS